MDDIIKIIIFCEPRSVHSVRWINQLSDTGWNIKVVSPVAPNWNYWIFNKLAQQKKEISNKIAPIELIQFHIGKVFQFLAFLGKGIVFLSTKLKANKINLNNIFNYLINPYWQKELTCMIKDFQPDVIHSLAINQDWRNLCLPILDLKQKGIITAPWIYSSWGTDLTFYPEMDEKIKLDVEYILRTIDYYISECNRDYKQAIKFGLRGKYLGSLPAFGGIHLPQMISYTSQGKISERKKIYIKGRGEEDPVGIAIEIMNALEENHTLLAGYEILVGQSTPSIIKKSKELKKKYNLNIRTLPYMKNPDDIFKIVGASRIFVSYTKNDGLPASLIESMVLGAFPIFSRLLSIEEWITNGENGFLVDVDDPQMLVEYLKRALLDDELVDRAGAVNRELIKQKLEYQIIKDRVIEIYKKVAEENRKLDGLGN